MRSTTAITSAANRRKRERRFCRHFFYLALLDETDPRHERAVAAAKIPRLLFTTEFILLELGNACARAEDHADFLALVAGMRASPRVRIIPLSPDLFNRGLARMRERVQEGHAAAAKLVDGTVAAGIAAVAVAAIGPADDGIVAAVDGGAVLQVGNGKLVVDEDKDDLAFGKFIRLPGEVSASYRP